MINSIFCRPPFFLSRCFPAAIDLKNGSGSLHKGPYSGKVDLSFTVSDEDFMDVVTGKIPPQKVNTPPLAPRLSLELFCSHWGERRHFDLKSLPVDPPQRRPLQSVMTRFLDLAASDKIWKRGSLWKRVQNALSADDQSALLMSVASRLSVAITVQNFCFEECLVSI